jgi:hypothetical protein
MQLNIRNIVTGEENCFDILAIALWPRPREAGFSFSVGCKHKASNLGISSSLFSKGKKLY